MKILIINYSDLKGGAYIAGYRLHRSLLENNIDSKILVQNKESNDNNVFSATYRIFIKITYHLDNFLVKFYRNKKKEVFSVSIQPFNNIVKIINKLNPDIVHLHWVCGGMLRIEDLAKIKVPIVWSLHDMWAFTGGCHYNKECGLYKNNCGNCLILGSKRKSDLSTKIFSRKMKTYSKIENMTIVSLSRWIGACAKESTLLKRTKIINIPNPIDTNEFKALDKNKAREKLGLNQNKKLVFFGALGKINYLRKGYHELMEAFNKLKIDDTEFVIFGIDKPIDMPNLQFKINYIGKADDDISLQMIYSAADVIVVPSLQENLSNVIMESMSCGTPVVAFDIGGNGDMIEHKITGYLAKPSDTTDLARGIDWVLEDKERHKMLSSNSRRKIEENFNSELVSDRYIDLYRQILRNEKL